MNGLTYEPRGAVRCAAFYCLKHPCRSTAGPTGGPMKEFTGARQNTGKEARPYHRARRVEVQGMIETPRA